MTQNKPSNFFFYLLLLTSFFFITEICIAFHFSGFYLGNFKLIADRIKIPVTIIPGIVFFTVIQLCLHFIFTVFVWGLARLCGKGLQCSMQQAEKIGFSLWVICLITLVLANQYFYPNSHFSILTGGIHNQTFILCLLLAASSLVLAAMLIGLYGLWLTLRVKKFLFLLSLILVCMSAVFFQQSKANQLVADAASQEKPNIILIGVDSLRPDMLGFFGAEKNTPHMDTFLNQSTVFVNAFTPLARTFPSWVSLLTGEYPKQNGIRTNLADQSQLRLSNTLPAILQRQGYETIFATDESQFSNIDQRFGFDVVMQPPMGVNEFLLGTFNDFPFSNLLVNTQIGQWLFPYSYSNRGAFATYRTNSFLTFIKTKLRKPRKKPVFLVIHFCLPHYPYFWGAKLANDKPFLNYRAAIEAADQQVGMLFSELKQDKFLNHAIVVLLSDHGEAIELPHDRITEEKFYVTRHTKKSIPEFYPPGLDKKEAVNESAGHGTDVLGLTQYHSLLAFQFYGLKRTAPVIKILDRVSLLDIKPTVLSYLNLSDRYQNGISLLAEFQNKNTMLSQRHFFIESDFSPQSIRTVHPEMKNVLFEGIDYFQIDPRTTRVTVKKEMERLILSSKQYADLYDHWILALYPQQNKKMTAILVDLNSGYWTDDLNSSFAEHSPVKKMLVALKRFYGIKI